MSELKIRKLLFSLLSVFFVGAVFAGSDFVTLSAKQKANVWLIKNIGQTSFWLNHPVKNPGASAGWGSEISPNRYSVLLLNKMPTGFILSCEQFESGKVIPLNCNKVLQVKLLKVIAIPKNFDNSSFWLAENLPYSKVRNFGNDLAKMRNLG